MSHGESGGVKGKLRELRRLKRSQEKSREVKRSQEESMRVKRSQSFRHNLN